MKWLWMTGTCVVVVIAGLMWQLSGRYSSFDDAIRANLTTQGVAVRAVEVIHAWPDTVNNITYGANLRVVLTSGAVYWGRLECRGWQRQCAYRLTSMHQEWQQLADLVKPSRIQEVFQLLYNWLNSH